MTQVAQAILNEIIQRVAAVAQSERIILFGSAARETMGPNSDVDLLVVKSGEFDQAVCWEIFTSISMELDKP